jgi:hypothetical protein
VSWNFEAPYPFDLTWLFLFNNLNLTLWVHGGPPSMNSWIYLFSKFTSEALLFQGAALFLLVAAYAGLWVLRRRRLGEEEITIKAGVVRNYLGALISDAEAMRRQLFAILQGEGLPPPHDLASPTGPSLAGVVAAPTASLANLNVSDPALKEKLAQFEAQMTAQTKALEGITLEKSRLEKELQSAKAAGGGAGSAPGGGGDTKALQDKIAELEGRLAEYSVIEDDLANLKRLQQENAQLKAQLSKAGGGAPAVEAAAPAVAAVEAAAEAIAPSAPEAATPAVAEAAPAEAAPAEAVAAPPGDAAADPLAGLADLAAAPAEATAEPAAGAPAADPLAALGDSAIAATPPAAEAPAPAASTAAAPAASVGSSDADLVAEFEKMLNG